MHLYHLFNKASKYIQNASMLQEGCKHNTTTQKYFFKSVHTE